MDDTDTPTSDGPTPTAVQGIISPVGDSIFLDDDDDNGQKWPWGKTTTNTLREPSRNWDGAINTMSGIDAMLAAGRVEELISSFPSAASWWRRIEEDLRRIASELRSMEAAINAVESSGMVAAIHAVESSGKTKESDQKPKKGFFVIFFIIIAAGKHNVLLSFFIIMVIKIVIKIDFITQKKKFCDTIVVEN